MSGGVETLSDVWRFKYGQDAYLYRSATKKDKPLYSIDD